MNRPTAAVGLVSFLMLLAWSLREMFLPPSAPDSFIQYTADDGEAYLQMAILLITVPVAAIGVLVTGFILIRKGHPKP